MDHDPTKFWMIVDGRKTGWGTYHTEREQEILDAMDRYVLTGEKPEELKFEAKSHYDGKKVDWIGLDEEGNWESADRIKKHWNVKPQMGNVFSTDKLCGNCFWFFPATGKCEYFKSEPDLCSSCMFFHSKESAKQILTAIVGSKTVEQ